MKSRTDVELLAEMEAEFAELHTAIAVMKRRMGISTDPSAKPAGGRPSVAASNDLREHGKPYLGMSILEASRKYLKQVQEPKAPSEIAEALYQGGVHSRSNDFNGIVRTTLFKRGHEVGIEKFGKGKWGLQDWRPGRTRSAAEPEQEG